MYFLETQVIIIACNVCFKHRKAMSNLFCYFWSGVNNLYRKHGKDNLFRCTYVVLLTRRVMLKTQKRRRDILLWQMEPLLQEPWKRRKRQISWEVMEKTVSLIPSPLDCITLNFEALLWFTHFYASIQTKGSLPSWPRWLSSQHNNSRRVKLSPIKY